MTWTHTRHERALTWLIAFTLIACLALEGTALGASRRGIDVSHYQGRIRWGRVAKTGVDFAFLKASEGVGVSDPRYRENRARATAAGIKVGAYHFARPSGSKKERVRDDARREANYFLSVARPKKKELAPVLDLETSGLLNRPQLLRWTQAWLKHVHRKTGVRPILYSGPTFWRDRMNGTRMFAAKHPLWLAHYTRRNPEVPAGQWDGKGWTYWQWTDCGRVRGIRGCVDLNVAASGGSQIRLDSGRVKVSLSERAGSKNRSSERRAEERQRDKRKAPKTKTAKKRDRERSDGKHRKKMSLRSAKRSPEGKKRSVPLQQITPPTAVQRGSRWPLRDHPHRSWTRWIG